VLNQKATPLLGLTTCVKLGLIKRIREIKTRQCQEKRFANEKFSRSFKAGWFSKWPWIHYLKDTDRAVCFVCCSAMEKKLISAERMREGVFMKGGFGNWRKAGDKFREHEKSSFHLEVVSKLSVLKQMPINALLSQAIAKDQVTAGLFWSWRFVPSSF
jgi:hypothetical protein